MKTSSSPKTVTHESEDDNSEVLPSATRATPAITAPNPSSRPAIVREPPRRLSDLAQVDENQRVHSQDGALGAGDAAGERSTDQRSTTHGSQDSNQMTSSEEERLAKLRDALNAKLVLQQRIRRSHGSSGSVTSKRISPIKEEGGSPYASSRVSSPQPIEVRTASTTSAGSVDSASSSKTIRASVPETPSDNVPVRTPSYPFPYVPGTPKPWPLNLHQPFTNLSPTTSELQHAEQDTPGNMSTSIMSEASTPAAANHAFLPPGTNFPRQEDPRFLTPNIYEMVLQLNSEPGLEHWWMTVTNLAHDCFEADRATLVMPLDPTDVENVPWAQKATFNMNGPEEFVSHRTVLEQTSRATTKSSRPDTVLRQPSTEQVSDFQSHNFHSDRLRPPLQKRHSYAGHGKEMKESFGETKTPGVRPSGPQRTVTHAAGMTSVAGLSRVSVQRLSSSSTLRNESMSDPEFSSVAGGVDAGPYAKIFPTLRALDHEVSPLIEPGGVNRVLERGRLVTVTRDYIPDSSNSANSASSATGTSGTTPDEPPKAFEAKFFGNYRSAFASDNAPHMTRDYEEYEQHPTSPWAQSPAPSPAIQADEETNPFFASEEQQVEESFNPASTPKDYSQFSQVQAIGVDNASTVIHIPLVHPTLSQPMQSLKMNPKSQGHYGLPQRSNALDLERKAPIAILSILSSTAPYPRNLIQSLKLLGPHLATSFAIAQQFSLTHKQHVTIRHRRTESGNFISNAPMTIEPTSLENIANAELEEPPGSVSGSVTSPSDYSGRSKHSPTGSIVSTPGWDPAAGGWTSGKSAAGTPAFTATEMVDNYFEARKRTGQRSSSNASAQAQTTPARPPKKTLDLETKLGARKPSPPGDEDSRLSRNENKPWSPHIKDEKSPLRYAAFREHSPPRTPQSTSHQRLPKQHFNSSATGTNAGEHHSQLHSYGADFESTFGLSAASTREFRNAGVSGHVREPSHSEDMPPPSERLLRTIIDSVPVQIFTAEPETGRLTWVNSKFLIYRGEEARQVLNEPWQAVHPHDRSELMAAWHRSLRTAQQLQQKVRLQRFDGSYRWFYVRAAPLKDKRQKIVHWFGTMMDFHEQHIAEINSAHQQETAASEAKYRALANSSPQIVFAVNRTKGVTFCNTQWLHYSGQTEAQALGVGFMDHVHPDDLAKCRLPTFDEGSDQPTNVPISVPPELKRKVSASAASSSGSSETERGFSSTDSSPLIAQMPQRKLSELASIGILKITRDADGRPSYSTEVRLKSKDGDFRWHLVRVLLAESPLQNSHHEEETWYGTCTDINDHKTLERDLKETMDEKSRFLSNMSHEIRTPLNGITGMVNFLIDSSLSAEQMEHVSIIRASTEGLRGLINDILDLSKAEAGMIQLKMDWIYLRALIEEVNDLTYAMAIDKGLELNYVVEENVPAQIKGDRFRIRQILLNIIGNAIKFTSEGEVFVRCSIRQYDARELSKNELYIKFEVIDTGRGFTDKEAEILFKRFSQIDGSSTRQHGGTGLGLVISRQLAQLHGGDMGAKGLPGKGATFTFFIKTTTPSDSDRPPAAHTSGGTSIPDSSILPGPIGSPGATPVTTPVVLSKLTRNMTLTFEPKLSPKSSAEYPQSPLPYVSSPDVTGRVSPSISSSSSDPSVKSAARTSSLRSEGSSVSSILPDISTTSPPLELALPADVKHAFSKSSELSSQSSVGFGRSDISNAAATGLHLQYSTDLVAPMYSILVINPLRYSREATVQHIEKTVPKNVPHQITARNSLAECQKMISGDDPLIFTHVVVVLQNVEEIVALMDQIFLSHLHHSTSIVIISDLAQRKRIMDQAPQYDYEELASERRLRFVFKPLKPSRFAIIFDPQKEREMSTDRNQDSAQQVAVTQKQVFEELTKRLGNKDKRVLLVEDNKTNQLVVMKFLSKVSIHAEKVGDGVECTEKVFSRPHGYFSIILCDLHMPNKDGYQTCKEIRRWEKRNKSPHIPIIALSANVLGDVYQKCVEAGFNSYMTKPVDFKELSSVLMTFMDPSDPNKPHEFMRKSAGHSQPLRR